MLQDLVNEIKAPELLAVLRLIETRGAIDIAHRVLQTCGQVFRYAIATGRAERDISADLRGALKTRKKQNYSRLEAKELPEFLSKLEEYDGELQTKLALKFLLLTFVRTGELRSAKWEEIDFEKKEWRIPAERMKMRQLHIVPLSTQSLDVLKERTCPVFFIQCCFLLFACDYTPAMPITYKHISILRRFTYSSLAYAISRSFMSIITSFGLVYLFEYCGYFGILVVLLPVVTVYIISINHFDKLEKEAGNYH